MKSLVDAAKKHPKWFSRSVTVFVLLCTILKLWSMRHFLLHSHQDFDLYYFGGLVERTGSYTDVNAVVAAATNAHRYVSSYGVYGSPSLVGLVFQPLSFLELSTAIHLWQITCIAAMTIAIRRATGGGRWWLAWLALAFIAFSNVKAFAIGNFAFFTTALLYFIYGSLRQGKSRQAGIALAIAIACKLYPVFLLLPLFLKAEKRVIRWTLGPLAIFLLATPFSLGWHDTVLAARSTLDIASYVHPWVENEGLPGAMLRITHSQTIAQWTTRVSITLAAIAIITLRKRASTPSLFVLATLLLTLSQGISWNMYYGLSILPLLAARDLRPTQNVWIALTIGCFFAGGSPVSTASEFFNASHSYSLTFGMVFLAAVFASQVQRPAADLQTWPERPSSIDMNQDPSPSHAQSIAPAKIKRQAQMPVAKLAELVDGERRTNDKSASPKIVVVMPAYNAAKTLTDTWEALPLDIVSDVLLVDDHSTDTTVQVAASLPIRVIALPHNIGYGGNQKTCYLECIRLEADIVVMVHPDGQYDPKLLPDLIKPIQDGKADIVLGSRMLTKGGARKGGMPLYRFVANKCLTRLENMMLGTSLSEAHTGYRAYSRSFLQTVPFMRNSNNFVFDTQIISQAVAFDQRITEVPIHTRYHADASSTSMTANIAYGLSTLWTTFRYSLHRHGLRSRLFRK